MAATMVATCPSTIIVHTESMHCHAPLVNTIHSQTGARGNYQQFNRKDTICRCRHASEIAHHTPAHACVLTGTHDCICTCLCGNAFIHEYVYMNVFAHLCMHSCWSIHANVHTSTHAACMCTHANNT